MKGREMGAAKVYLAYAVALLFGFILARFQASEAMRYAFLAYLAVFFAFTGALPYLLPDIPKGAPGWMRHAFIKIAFPLLAVVGVVLVIAILIKVGV